MILAFYRPKPAKIQRNVCFSKLLPVARTAPSVLKYFGCQKMTKCECHLKERVPAGTSSLNALSAMIKNRKKKT